MKRVYNWADPKRIDKTIAECNCKTPGSCKKTGVCIYKFYRVERGDFWSKNMLAIAMGFVIGIGVFAILTMFF